MYALISQFLDRIRPQILLAMILITGVAVYAMYQGGYPEVVTGTVVGLVGMGTKLVD